MVNSYKTADSLSVFGTIILVAAVVVGAFQGIFVDQDVQQAIRDAESLGNQIIAGGLKNLPSDMSSQSRAIASISGNKSLSQMTKWGVMRLEGTIGVDPWGQKFHYKIIPDLEKNKVAFMVWSNGPNKTEETSKKDAVANLPKKNGKLSLHGDDIGNVQIIPL